MTYYLGIKDNKGFQPLNLINLEDDFVSNKILDIIKFTNQFETLQELKSYLFQKQIIMDNSSDFYYLISKGKKDNKTYEVINMGDTVYLADSSNFFYIDFIKQFIILRKNNKRFIKSIYAFYIKKLGILSKAINYIKTLCLDKEQLSAFLIGLLSKDFSDDLKIYLKKIIDCTTSNSIIFTPSQKLNHSNLLNGLYNQIAKSNDDTILLVNILASKINYYIPFINYLQKMYNFTCQNSYSILEEQCDEDLFEAYLDNFINFLVYLYDKTSKSFKQVNSKFKVQERNLCDLGMLLYNYHQYEIELANEYDNIKDEEESEEFLEESDFARCNTTSEEQGFNLRKQYT